MQLAEKVGFKLVTRKEKDRWFFLELIKPQSITRNSSPSGKTLIRGLLRLRMRGRGWLG